MILEWIDPKNRKLHENEDLQKYSDITAINDAPYAYIDDLATCSAGPQAEDMQQLQWLSAFYALSGLTIYLGKIKATIVGKIDPKHELKMKPDGTKYCPSTVTVYDYQWKPTECPINPTLISYKYLGVHLDLHCKHNDALEREKAKAAAICLIS
jgi:hypothetical protein